MESQSKLGYEVSTILALAVLAEILKLSSKSYMVVVLHPFGGGLYQTYSLVDDKGPDIQLNVLGNSALAGTVVENIWIKAGKSPKDLARELIVTANLEVSEKMTSEKFNLVNSLIRLAEYLDLNIDKNLMLDWGWEDSTYGSNANPNLESNFKIPEHWKSVGTVHEMFDWQANIYFVLDSLETPIFAMNLVLNEVINPDGSDFKGLAKATSGPDALPTFPVAKALVSENPEHNSRQLWHSSMARYAAKLQMEETLTNVQLMPVFELPDFVEVQDFWLSVTSRDDQRRV